MIFTFTNLSPAVLDFAEMFLQYSTLSSAHTLQFRLTSRWDERCLTIAWFHLASHFFQLWLNVNKEGSLCTAEKITISFSLFKSRFFLSSPGSRTANVNWLDFKQALAAAVNKNVPSKISTDGTKHPSWLNASVFRHIRKRDNLAKKAECSGTEADRANCQVPEGSQYCHKTR